MWMLRLRDCLGNSPNEIKWIQLEKAQTYNEHFITENTAAAKRVRPEHEQRASKDCLQALI